MKFSRLITQTLKHSIKPISQNPNPNFPKSIFNSPIFKNSPFTSRTVFSLFSPRGYSTESKLTPSENVSSIVDEITGLTLLEVSDLVDLLRQKLDVQDMPVMGVMMPGMGVGMKGKGAKGGGVTEEKVEKTAFDLKLEGGYDASAKIKIIKEVRACTDLGLKEAKELVEKAPSLLKKGVPKDEAEKIIAKLKEVGAKVSMD
ncbi:54S ribosomal protein L12, mitochondrial [Heracleum sosnowskyi]|uniref:Large ribosomal subunit protein bL12c n=1 Tax=Heracleum sosnowskyi TaxID=360622 RepID=A0AAD8M8M3_9APIA|nr:54S ribosomal protein L12, mitochondrial [Heracleum sosnowskyi]